MKITRDGCAPLFISCKRGNVEISEYLITICDADVEQKGMFEVPVDRSVHCVTPLWCAAVSGKLPVVKCLIRLGSCINSLSDTGSTPVRSACYMTNMDIVHYLVEHGADIKKPNYNGGTCLINSVQSVQLCMYLISKGADVNAKDIQDKTALHYAIQEHRFVCLAEGRFFSGLDLVMLTLFFCLVGWKQQNFCWKMVPILLRVVDMATMLCKRLA